MGVVGILLHSSITCMKNKRINIWNERDGSRDHESTVWWAIYITTERWNQLRPITLISLKIHYLLFFPEPKKLWTVLWVVIDWCLLGPYKVGFHFIDLHIMGFEFLEAHSLDENHLQEWNALCPYFHLRRCHFFLTIEVSSNQLPPNKANTSNLESYPSTFRW